MRRRTTLLAAVASLALLAGCSDGDADEPTPPPGSAGPVPTATPFPTDPVPTIVIGENGGATGGGSAESTYEVQPGDTLSGIAETHGVTVEEIQAANDLSGTDIFVGQEITIPGSTGDGDAGTGDGGGTPSDGGGTPSDGGGTPSDGGGSPPSTGDGEAYTVLPGDTAIGIAAEFGVTLEELAAANDMTEDELSNLFAGQEIQIPGGN